MNSKKDIFEILYLFKNGKIGIQESNLKELLKGIRASRVARHDEWMEDDNMLNSYNENPFKITCIKFNEDKTKLEYVEFEEEGRI